MAEGPRPRRRATGRMSTEYEEDEESEDDSAGDDGSGDTVSSETVSSEDDDDGKQLLFWLIRIGFGCTGEDKSG